MRYFIIAEQRTKPANKLQQAISDYLAGLDRMIIANDADLLRLKEVIAGQIIALNRKYHRCRPQTGYWHGGSGLYETHTSLFFNGGASGWCFSFTIYHAKN